MKVAVGLRRVAAGKRTSGRRAAQIALMKVIDKYVKQNPAEKENKTLERFFDLLDVMDMEW